MPNCELCDKPHTPPLRQRLCARCWALQVSVSAAPDWLLAKAIGWRRTLQLAETLATDKLNEHKRLVSVTAKDDKG